MPDRETVMSWLEGLAQPDWHKFHSDTEVQVIAESALDLLKEYKRQDGCPCTHCMEWECDEVCEEYKKWKDT